jgi:Pyruvate/2-oxoacid:ferredoxin oxidoreductase gamma subunit
LTAVHSFKLPMEHRMKILSSIPGQVKKYIADHNINFYIIDGVKIGIEIGMGPTRINTILQSAFFKLTGISFLRKRQFSS